MNIFIFEAKFSQGMFFCILQFGSLLSRAKVRELKLTVFSLVFVMKECIYLCLYFSHSFKHPLFL